ncbi:MAG TPA: hypothetical protein PLI47_01360 [Bacteroidia bacterium]|nr:hypothetical protein [Bacteroidia bacterium]
MKKYLILQLLLLFLISTSAQINIGTPGAIKPANFKKKDMELYQSLKTYFVIREMDKDNQAEIEKILQQVWKFNKYEIIDFDRYKAMSDDGNALFFGLRNYNTSSEYTSNSDLAGKFAQSSELKIQLWRNLPKEKPQLLNEDVLAYIELGTHWRLSSELTKRISIDAFEYICKTDTVVKEWSWGFLKNYLQEINRHLIANEPRWRFESDVDKENISKLNTQALWVSSDIKNSYDSRAKEDPFEKYAGKKIEMISPSDLSAKILESAIPFYYMKVYMGGTDKVITIINSATGEFLYSDYSGMAYFFKDKDVKELNGNLK